MRGLMLLLLLLRIGSPSGGRHRGGHRCGQVITVLRDVSSANGATLLGRSRSFLSHDFLRAPKANPGLEAHKKKQTDVSYPPTTATTSRYADP